MVNRTRKYHMSHSVLCTYPWQLFSCTPFLPTICRYHDPTLFCSNFWNPLLVRYPVQLKVTNML